MLLLYQTVYAAPAGTIFQPWVASPFEPQLSVAFFLGSDYAQLDIGGRVPVISAHQWSIGVEGLTLSRLRRERNFKFPVEVVDYYFGFDFQLAGRWQGLQWALRTRLGHISAHVVDGGMQKYPIFVYSQEFLSTTVRWKWRNLALLTEVTWLFSVLPANIDPWQPAVGMEIRIPFLMTHFVGSYQLRFVGIQGQFTANHRVVARMHWRSLPIGFFVTAYQGKSYHGMFYQKWERFLSVGISIASFQ